MDLSDLDDIPSYSVSIDFNLFCYVYSVVFFTRDALRYAEFALTLNKLYSLFDLVLKLLSLFYTKEY